MTAYSRSREGKLDDIMTILGSTGPVFVPGWNATGSNVGALGIAAGFTVSDESGAVNLEDEYSPVAFPSGLYHYGFVTALNHNFSTADAAGHSFGDGTEDEPFSVGLILRPHTVGTAMDLVCKYVAVTEEYKLAMTNAGLVFLELHDASASASWIATADTALEVGKFHFIVATYDGAETDPEIHLYVNGSDYNAAGTATESGTYTAMENTATPLQIGAGGLTAAPTLEVAGRLAFPFITGKELSATEVGELTGIVFGLAGIA